MSLNDFQTLFSIFAVSVGIVYLIGGLVVNLHLSRYGVSEYKLIKAKYLAVGLNFLFSIGIVVGLVLVINLVFPVKTVATIQRRLVISLFSLFLIAAIYNSKRFHSISKNLLVRVVKRREQVAAFHIWWLTTFGTTLFPISLAISYHLMHSIANDFQYIQRLTLLALLIGFGGLAFSTLYFGVEIYANPVPTGPEAADLIGTGKLQKVKLIIDPKNSKMIKHLGIPMETLYRTSQLGLLDETEDQYLVIIPNNKGGKAAKVSRDLIKGIAYQTK